MATSQVTNTEIYGTSFRLKDNARLLLKTDLNDWFLIKRVGQRSWEAVCVAEKYLNSYQQEQHHTIHGNSANLLDLVEDKLGVKELHEITSMTQYRQAMMSIMASGEISNIIDVEVTKGIN